MSPAFDPLYFVTNHGQRLDDRFRFFHYLVESGRAANALTISRAGDRVTVELKAGDITTRYVGDLSHGGNPVAFEISDGTNSSSTKVAIEHARVNGVWIPRHFTFQQQNKLRKSTMRREIEWTESHINVPIPETQFSLAALGTRPNDLIEDLRTKKFTTYHP